MAGWPFLLEGSSGSGIAPNTAKEVPNLQGIQTNIRPQINNIAAALKQLAPPPV
jgi:hypothetical protein